jgi:hypothetical protein
VPPLADGNSARDVALAEFNALRAEINNRMTTTAALVGVGLTALGVIVSLVVKEDGDERLLLTVPPLAIAVNFLWAVENRQVGLIGRYIRTRLWPYLREGDDRLPSWEEDCAERRHGLVNVLRSIGTDFALTLVFVVAAASSLVIPGGQCSGRRAGEEGEPRTDRVRLDSHGLGAGGAYCHDDGELASRKRMKTVRRPADYLSPAGAKPIDGLTGCHWPTRQQGPCARSANPLKSSEGAQ